MRLKDALNESVNEGKYYVTYNRGRGQGKGLEKEFDQKSFSSTDKPKVFNSYNDAKKYAEKMEKMFQHSIGGGTAYWVSDEKMNPIKESVTEEKVYIDYLNKAKGFKQDRIKFNSYEDAVKWARQNFDKFDRDMIKYESINEVTYDLGKKQYTDKNMTPTEILELAMAYAQTPVTKIVGNKHEYRVRSANDLAKLNGTTQSDVKTRGKQPALILFLLKNELVSKEEYVKLYKVLLAKQIEVIRYLKNSSPEMRNSGGAMRAAEKDGRGEFGESVNEVGINKMYVKFLAVSKKVRELEDAQKELSQKYFTEKDLNKKEALLTQLKKGTETLKGFRRNLSDIEEKYVMNLDTDTELDF